jgi:hypothetical protein
MCNENRKTGFNLCFGFSKDIGLNRGWIFILTLFYFWNKTMIFKALTSNKCVNNITFSQKNIIVLR